MNATPVRPCRSYRVAQERNGPVVMIRLEFRAAPEVDLRALIKEGNEITRQEIEGWKGTMSFTAADLDEFYWSINLLRVTVPWSEALPKSYPFKRIQAALKGLEMDLPLQIADWEDKRAVAAMAEARSFVDSVARMRKYVGDDIPPVHRKFQAWHDDALYLAYKTQKITTARRGRCIRTTSRLEL